MVSEIELEMEMTLDYGSTDGKSLDDVADEISETFEPIMEGLNPFTDGTTTVDVDIQFIDACVDYNGNQAPAGVTCDPEAGNRRKRSAQVDFLGPQNVRWTLIKRRPIAVVKMKFAPKSIYPTTLSGSPEISILL